MNKMKKQQLLLLLLIITAGVLMMTFAEIKSSAQSVGTPPMPWAGPTLINVDLTMLDSGSHYVSFQLQDDGTRRTRVEVWDDSTTPGVSKLLDSRTVTNFRTPVYLTYYLRGHVRFAFNREKGADVRVNGIFFDSTLPTPLPAICVKLPNGKCKN